MPGARVLQVLDDGAVRSRRELLTLVADRVGLSDAQRAERLPGGQSRFENRIGWALSFLANVGALERPQRGHYEITQGGRMIAERYPDHVREREIKALGDDPAWPMIRPYVATNVREPHPSSTEAEAPAQTPIEQVEEGVGRIVEEVSAELLARLRGKDPEFFERAVVDLLLAMGYGGVNGRGQVTQLSNDRGVDGVIDQDVLGLSRVYVQATPVRIVLMDGEQLARLMIQFKVGTQVRKVHELVEVDEDFFA